MREREALAGADWTAAPEPVIMAYFPSYLSEVAMQNVKVSSKGQIVIPKALRVSRRITAGSEFVICAVGDELRLTPAPAFAKTLVRDAAGILRRAGRKRLAEDETRRAIGKLIGTRDKATQGR